MDPNTLNRYAAQFEDRIRDTYLAQQAHAFWPSQFEKDSGLSEREVLEVLNKLTSDEKLVAEFQVKTPTGVPIMMTFTCAPDLEVALDRARRCGLVDDNLTTNDLEVGVRFVLADWWRDIIDEAVPNTTPTSNKLPKSSAREIRVILPAGEIPLGSTVTKLTGTKLYVIKDKLRLFGEGHPQRHITAEQGTVFLVCDGDANGVGTTTPLVWVTSRDTLQDYLSLQDYLNPDERAGG